MFVGATHFHATCLLLWEAVSSLVTIGINITLFGDLRSLVPSCVKLKIETRKHRSPNKVIFIPIHKAKPLKQFKRTEYT